MHFTPTIVALVAFVTSVTAAIVPNTVNLFNGKEVISTPVGDILERRAPPNHCSGSPYCSNDQSLKNACSVAYSRLQGTIYSNGGSKSGVCDGHCGLFVQGTYKSGGKTLPCTADLATLSNAFQAIQGNCQTCGWVTSPQAPSCLLKVDYVGSC